MRLFLQWLMRSMPVFPGKLRLAKLLLGDLRGSARVKDDFGFTYEVPDLREPIAFHLLINGAYEPEIQDLLLRALPVGGVFIDVGANIGTFTIPAAKHVGPSGRVIAIEPSPDVFKILERNIALNNAGNVQPICAAAGTNDGDTNFYPAPIDHFGMGSHAPQFDSAPITVPGVTLDSLVERLKLPSVNLIKVDVEGFELDVFKGATELLNREKPPLIVFEFCDWAEARMSTNQVGSAQRFLLDHGFQIWRASDYQGVPITDPLMTGGDMLVARR